MGRPEDYGAIPNGITNCAAAINACILATNSCEFSDGTYIIGSPSMTTFAESTISFGWTPAQRDGVTFTGTGKTVLKLADGLCANPSFAINGFEYRILQAIAEGGDGRVNIRNIRISGITFDGNYNGVNNNPAYPRLTTAGISTFGDNTIIENCTFQNFNVGSANATSFAIISMLSTNSANNAQGATVRNCSFKQPGRVSSYTYPGSPEQVVYIQVGGNLNASKIASGCVVSGNTIRGDVNTTDQLMPLAGVSIANTIGARVTGNNFDTYEGKCIYIDTGTNYQPLFSGNSALDVPNFVSLTTQNYGRIYGPAFAIWNAQHNTPQFTGNTVRMKGPWNWNPALYAAWPAVFFGYVLDRDLDLNFPWFKGITFKDNNVDIPADAVQTRNLGGYWPPLSSFQSGIPFGPVPPEPVAAQIFFFSPAAVAWRQFP
jgi:hypothetical protein